MATAREEAFETALEALRRRLLDGRFPPGERIPAVTVADELRLSATPIREALSRLAGEGLVDERRHQGFFAKRPTGADVADLYRLAQAHLLILLAQERAIRHDAPEPERLRAEPVRAVEAFCLGWLSTRGSTALYGAYRSAAVQLGPIRRTEPLILDGLAEEAEAFVQSAAADPAPEVAQTFRRFHARRIAVADRLAQTYLRRGGLP